jgi:hypothetical protein
MRHFVDTVTIDFEHHQVLVPVQINGQTYRFLLDTGAGHAVIYDDRPIEGCLSAGSILSRDAIGREDSVPLVTLPPLTIGRLTLTGCQATVQHRTVPRKGIDGILGFDLVCRGIHMKIDTRQRLLVLTDQKKFFKQEPGIALRYKLNYHVPYVQVEPFCGYRERVFFDTGSRQFYAMNKASFDRGSEACMRQNPQQVEGRSVGRHAIGLLGTEPIGEVVFLNIDSLCLGSYSFGNLHTLTTQGGSHLGARLLDYGSVVFNPSRRRIIFQPYEEGDRTMVGNRQLQKAIVNNAGLPTVGLVWERSEAYKAGLRQGDVILKADDQPIRSFAEYMAFRPLRGRAYTFTVRDRCGFLKEVLMPW